MKDSDSAPLFPLYKPIVVSPPTPPRIPRVSIHLQKRDGRWECLEVGFRFTHFFLAKELATGNSAKEAYENAFPPTVIGKLKKCWRNL